LVVIAREEKETLVAPETATTKAMNRPLVGCSTVTVDPSVPSAILDITNVLWVYPDTCSLTTRTHPAGGEIVLDLCIPDKISMFPDTTPAGMVTARLVVPFEKAVGPVAVIPAIGYSV
jgi:hypothetical protein